jgi:hypothetical protein
MLAITQRPDAKTDIQDTIRWHYTHEMVDAGKRAEMMMFFSLPGFQNWQFRYVLMGGTMQLEAVQNDLHLTVVLTPLESISRQADQLIRCSMHQD